MKFYQELSNYYEEVFPTGEKQTDFLKEIVGKEPKRVIDIACGNGVYAIQLAKEGHIVLGIDLSLGMVQKAHELAKAEDVRAEFRACSMLEIDEVVEHPYDIAFCIGNSLVHLRTLREVQSFFNLTYGVLNQNAKIVIQIINYDRILDKQVMQLPTIYNAEKKLCFERNYHFNEETKRIDFNTILKINEECLENTVELIPLRKAELVEIMENEGFKIERVYGDFEKNIYTEESFHCIIVASK